MVQGIDDINQCFGFILTTQTGTDPLRPLFGVDLLASVDKPVNVMAPRLVKAIIEAIADYEPRVDLNSVNYTQTITGQTLFGLTWSFKEGTLYNGGNTPQQTYTSYFLLSDQNGFILLDDYNVSIIVK